MALAAEINQQVITARELKGKFITFYEKREKKYRPILAESFAQARDNPAQRENVIDWFLHEYRFRTGETMIDKFIATSQLTDEECQMLLSWKNSFEGFFEIIIVDMDQIQVRNMFDNTEYTLVSGKDDNLVSTLSPGQFILSRVDPMDTICLLTGIPHVFPQESEKYVRKMVDDVLKKQPELAVPKRITE